MTYSTIDNVFSRYNPIVTLVGSGGNKVTSLDVTSLYIRDADAMIDSFLGARYVTPVTSAALLTGISADLSIFNMCAERLPKVPDFMQGRYDRAMKMLEMLRDGEMILPGATANTSGSSDQDVWSTTMDFHPIFSPVLDPLDQRVDSDRVERDRDTRSDDAPAVDDC